MKDHYFQIRVIDTTHPTIQMSRVVWQHVQSEDDGSDAKQVKFVDENGIEVVPPRQYEAHHLSSPPDPHYAPGVRLDPNAGYQPPAFDEFNKYAAPVFEANKALEDAKANGGDSKQAQAALDKVKAVSDAWNASNIAAYKASGLDQSDAARAKVSAALAGK